MRSFTIIELVIAILVIGIIGVAVTPKLLDIAKEAKIKNEASTVGNVREGIGIVHHDNYTRGVTPLYPAHLDSANTAPASSQNPIFANVLQLPIISQWEKTGTDRYKGPTGEEYEYDPQRGTFKRLAVEPSDGFSGTAIDTDRWRTTINNPAHIGINQNNGLHMTFDGGEGNYDGAAIMTKYKLTGNFDVEVGLDLSNTGGYSYNGDLRLPIGTNHVYVGVKSNTAGAGNNIVFIMDDAGGWQQYSYGSSYKVQLRLVRANGQITRYYRPTSSSSWTQLGGSVANTADQEIWLRGGASGSNHGNVTVSFNDFKVSSGETVWP